MKNASKYSKTIGGGYLTTKEQELLDKVINQICDNHVADAWWKIECSIKRRVEYILCMRLADDSFREDMDNYKEG